MRFFLIPILTLIFICGCNKQKSFSGNVKINSSNGSTQFIMVQFPGVSSNDIVIVKNIEETDILISQTELILSALKQGRSQFSGGLKSNEKNNLIAKTETILIYLKNNNSNPDIINQTEALLMSLKND